MTLEIQEFLFEYESKAKESEKDILEHLGKFARLEGNSLFVEAPFDKAPKAREIAEQHGGKLNTFRLF